MHAVPGDVAKDLADNTVFAMMPRNIPTRFSYESRNACATVPVNHCQAPKVLRFIHNASLGDACEMCEKLWL